MRRKMKPVLTTFRVWVEQVNQTYVDVKAPSPSDAYEKAYRKWRRESAHARMSYIEIVKPKDAP